jgi:hypothetical protein
MLNTDIVVSHFSSEALACRERIERHSPCAQELPQARLNIVESLPVPPLASTSTLFTTTNS